MNIWEEIFHFVFSLSMMEGKFVKSSRNNKLIFKLHYCLSDSIYNFNFELVDCGGCELFSIILLTPLPLVNIPPASRKRRRLKFLNIPQSINDYNKLVLPRDFLG